MRVEVAPRQAEIIPGVALPIAITITNSSTVIGGYSLRVLGADPGWVDLPDEQISLFPEDSQTIVVMFTPPAGLAAGSRRLAVQVRELTPPYDSVITELDLTVPAAPAVQVRLDPITVTAGRKGEFGIVVANEGNTVIEGALAGDDPEGEVEFTFEPARVSLAPGQRAIVDLQAKAKRHLVGSPVVRVLEVYLDDRPGQNGFFNDDEPAAKTPPQAPPRDPSVVPAQATLVQKPALSRGAMSLLGLLAAVTVFAIVITFAMSRLVGQSAADRDLALQVAAAREGSGGGGTASLSGTVRLITDGKPARAVSVSVYAADDTSTAVATTATGADGKYSLGNLAGGDYKLTYRSAGFVQVWYPAAVTEDDGATVSLADGIARNGLDVVVGGVPATIKGRVLGKDVSASTLYLEKPPAAGSSTAAAAANEPIGSAAPPDNHDAVVQSIPIGSDGTFDLAGVPSPSVYDLVVTKPGFATTTQSIDIGAGETRSGVTLTLVKGDGLISGAVRSPDGPLGGVTITATSGQTSVNTVSLESGSNGDPGTFTLRGLPTPASFTITARLEGYTAQTQTVSLAAGQKLTGVSITLLKSSGQMAGVVSLVTDWSPKDVPVTVTVTNGDLTVQTQTREEGREFGHWQVSGLPVPGTYTVTFARSDLASQTVSVALDSSGRPTEGSQGANVNASTGQILVSMQSATAVVHGTVRQHRTTSASSPADPVGEAVVTLSSGSASYLVTTASLQTGSSRGVGEFRLDNVPPGTWTLSVERAGANPISQIITLVAGQDYGRDQVLSAPLGIRGVVKNDRGGVLSGWIVQLYRAADYPNVAALPVAKTGTDGTFQFSPVDAGETYVVVVREAVNSAEAESVNVLIDGVQQTKNLGTITVRAG